MHFLPLLKCFLQAFVEKSEAVFQNGLTRFPTKKPQAVGLGLGFLCVHF